MYLFNIIRLELEETGKSLSHERLINLKNLLSTSSPIQLTNIRNRILHRYHNKESLITIIEHIESQLSMGALQ